MPMASYVSSRSLPGAAGAIEIPFEVSTDQTIHSGAWRNRQRRKR
jgi:hypothetical protein